MLKLKHMTEEEILTSYRDAKDKKAQITILAQLNDCTQDDMLEWLRARVDPKTLPRSPRQEVGLEDRAARAKFARVKYSESKKKSAEPCISVSGSSEVGEKQVLEYIASLQKQRAALLRELSSIDAALRRIRDKTDVIFQVASLQESSDEAVETDTSES